MGSKNWTDKQLVEAVARFKTKREVVFSLGLSFPSHEVSRRIDELKLDTRHWSYQKVSDARFIEIIQTSKTKEEVHKTLGVRYFTKRAKQLNIDTSHLLDGRRFNGSKESYTKEQKQEVLNKALVINSSYTGKLKPLLVELGYLDNKCYECDQEPVWRDKLLILHLHHINGDSFDNRLENLTILCPNCHTQTNNYGGKNYGRGRAIRKRQKP